MNEPGPEDLSFPNNWDRLSQQAGNHETPDPPEDESTSKQAAPPLIILLAAAWGDVVTLLVVCTAGLVALVGFGHRVSPPCLPWAVALAVVWWGVSSAVLLVVRRGTPGMLVAGLAFTEPVPPPRVALVLAVSLVVSLTLGLPAVLGARRSPQAAAAGSPLRLTG